MKQYLLLLFLLLFCSVFSQTRIEIVQAEELKYNKREHQARKLIGNVVLKHEEAFMYCDSAYLYSKENQLEAFHNVKIIQGDSIVIKGNNLNYNGNSQIAFIEGEVSMIDNDMKLTTDKLKYDRNLQQGSYYTGGVIITTENIVESKIGVYNSSTKMIYFKTDVVLTSDDYKMESDTLNYYVPNETAYFFGPTIIRSKENTIYCEKGRYNTKDEQAWFSKNTELTTTTQHLKTDSLYYNKILGISETFKNTSIYDKVDEYILQGNYVHYFENIDSSFITESPLLSILLDDTLFMHADTLIAFIDSNGHKKAFAYHGVKMYKPNLQGKCDSLIYQLGNEKMEMFYNPVLWSDVNQISADKIDFYLSQDKLDSMHLFGNPFITSKDDTLQFNQIKGKKMRGYFYNNELRIVNVSGNGHTLYFIRDNQNLIGMNSTYCSEMRIDVNQNEIKQIVFKTKPEATVYPREDVAIEEKFLEGFKWRENERPLKKEDIFK